MLHTLVGTDDDAVREIVREPMKEYLRAALKLTLGFAWTFSAFKRPGGPGATPEDIDLSSLSEDEVDAILEFAFERYFETSGLFGTPVTCLKMINRCKAAGVDEVACLMDFGADLETVFESMPNLKLLRDRANKQAADATPSDLDQSIGAQIERLKTQPGARGALRSVEHLMIGGEAFPPDLARELDGITGGTITNMYGPTETTIWSSTQVINGAAEPIAIGRPIANTVMYVLDEYQQPVPPGVPGDLYIGGAGVVRGYHARSELTNQRFLPDPFHQGRMYWTGDLARFRSDGVIDFLGRVDYQAKLHGYRIELGEIESRISELESVKECVVVIREREPDDKRLVAYIVPSGEPTDEATFRKHLRRYLPEYMVPSHFPTIDRMPLTPNGKIDRLALPSLDEIEPRSSVPYVAPANELEDTIARLWCQTLGHDRVGTSENFFDIGGHSLLIIALHREWTAALDRPVALVDLYRFPTVRALAEHLSSSGTESAASEGVNRAALRRRARRRQRTR